MCRALFGLQVGLQTIALLLEQARHSPRADLVPLTIQLNGELCRALACPPQW